MIIVPKTRPVIENLNSYYLDIAKLIEHFQGDIGSGGIHLKSSTVEAALFFDDNGICSGTLQEKQQTLLGEAAVARIFSIVLEANFNVAVFAIEPEMIHFWSSLSQAQEIYSNLSTEFTDLEGLLNKMASEKLTGYVDIRIGGGQDSGLIFFMEGSIAGSSCSWESCGLDTSVANRKLLIQKARDQGAVFNVYRIEMTATNDAPAKTPAPPTTTVVGKPVPKAKPQPRAQQPLRYLDMSGEFLSAMEALLTSTSKNKEPGDLSIRRKFIEKADTYDFLDPFADEFHYSEGKVIFQGDVPHAQVAQAVVDCVLELVREFDLQSTFSERIQPLKDKYDLELKQLKVEMG